jgi:hypothetical protein
MPVRVRRCAPCFVWVWTCGRVVDCTGLENRKRRKAFVGPNPTGSAMLLCDEHIARRRSRGKSWKAMGTSVWRNWQTRLIQDQVAARLCGFESHHRYQVVIIMSQCVGIGRQSRPKRGCAHARVGSTPTAGTIFIIVSFGIVAEWFMAPRSKRGNAYQRVRGSESHRFRQCHKETDICDNSR